MLGSHSFVVDARYRVLKHLGSGSFGCIAGGLDLATNEKIAIKKIANSLEDVDGCKHILREVRLLKHFRDHENVVSLVDIMAPAEGHPWNDVYLVLEKMDTDLHYVIHSNQQLSMDHVQWIMYQLIRGLKAIHSAQALHRDLKPSNVLVNANVDVKICDFGLARGVDASCSPKRHGKLAGTTAHTPLTEYVVTRWYRAPELLVQNHEYDTGVDMWSVGCILAECLSRQVLFKGKDYLHQTRVIVEALKPDEATLVRTVEHGAAKDYIRALSKLEHKPIRDRMPPDAHPLALALLERLLAFDAADRPTAADALGDAYFSCLHGLNDEPDAPPFDFAFEAEGVSEAELRDLVYEEMLEFQPELAARHMEQPMSA